MRRAGNRLRITSQLINVANGYHLWSERYDREMEDIFAIQDEITAAIVKVLEVQLVGGAEEARVKRGTANMDAYELYLRGRYFWGLRLPAAMYQAREYFERAIELDPEFAAAYAGLADSYGVLGAYQVIPPQEAERGAMPALQKALELDNSLAEALYSRAFATTWFSDEWPSSRGDYERALALNPADSHARSYYAIVLAACNQPEEAITEVQEALRRDPLSVFVHAMYGFVQYINGQFDEAIVILEKGLEVDPNSALAQWLLAWNYGHRRW